MRRTSYTLLLAIVLSGCRAPTAPTPIAGPTAPPTNDYRVRETRLLNGMVSVRVDIPLTPEGRKPTVIAQLGDTSPLVRAGFVAVTYTVYWDFLRTPGPTPPPGHTVGKWVLASPSADVLGQTYLHDIAQNADQVVPAILDWLATQPEVDTSRFGIVGGSTNGFVTLQALAADARLRAAVVIAACGDYECFLRNSSMGMQGQPLTLSPSYAAWVHEQDVTYAPQRVVHAALLMLNRTGDELIPYACAETTARTLSQAYAAAGAPERFEQRAFDIEGHGIGPQETQATLAWLQRWLAPPAS